MPTSRRALLPGSPALRAWLAVAACALLIWTLSGESFSAAQTSSFLAPLLQWLWPGIRPITLYQALFAVRKFAHLAEYALLGCLAYRALRTSLPLTRLRGAVFALGVVLFVAGVDEARQALLPARTGSLVDVAIDLAGGALGVYAIVAVQRRFGASPDTARSAAR